MKYLLILFFITSFALMSCNDKKLNLVDKVFVYTNGPEKQMAGFDEKYLYLKWDDSLGIATHKTEYSVKTVNDSTYTIELKEKPSFWDKNTWEIVALNPNEFYTIQSKKHYKFLKSGVDLK
ncbi:MAG: hypothetical protein J0M18_08610 [Ignavibacteria bacterium]|nr:hypothetical protein [Ignavibacteria bacterium]